MPKQRSASPEWNRIHANRAGTGTSLPTFAQTDTLPPCHRHAIRKHPPLQDESYSPAYPSSRSWRSASPRSRTNGREVAFEVFAEGYLVNQRKQDVSNVWPLAAAPIDLL